MNRLIIKANIKNHFIFSGYRNDIPKVLASVDIIVFPSLLPEGFGRPIIEGMASGIPVIASDTGPSEEILGRNAGLIVPANNSSKLTKALKYLISDSDTRAKMGEFGIKRIFNRFNLTDTVKSFNKIIESCIAE